MQKTAPYMIISALFLVVCLAACGGSSSSSSATAVYDLPAKFGSYSSSGPHLMGGAIQGTPLVLSGTASTLAGTAGTAGFMNYSTPNGPQAVFNHPSGMATDGTKLYVADYYNNMIRQIDIVSKRVELFAGSAFGIAGHVDGIGTAALFYHPADITTDGNNLYVADYENNSIRVINIETKTVTTIGSIDGLVGSADSTVPTDVRFNHPTGVTTDGKNIYVTDYGNATIRRIDSDTHAVYTLAGTSGEIGTADYGVIQVQGAARFNRPGRITTDGISLFVTDFLNRTIRRIEIRTGAVSTIAGSSGRLGQDGGTLDGTGAAASFHQPNGITTDGTYLYVTDSFLNIIRKIVIDTGEVTTLVLPGGTLHTPVGITTDGKSLFVADTSLLNSDNTSTYSNSIINIQ